MRKFTDEELEALLNDTESDRAERKESFQGDAAAPYVKATAAQMSASERLRIQAVLDSRSGQLLLSLLAMSEHSAAGNAVTVAANGNYTLPGFSGSAVSSLSVKVENYAGLVALLKSGYRGRMVDVLDVGM